MTSREPVGYRHIADKLRAQIESGELAPGQRMPSEKDLAQTYGVANGTARAAMGLLRTEGLIMGRRGFPARVRDLVDRVLYRVPRGSSWVTRMPTAAEVRDLGIPAAVPVVEMTLPSGEVRILRGDQTRFTSS